VPRCTVLTISNRRGCSVIACWQRNWQLTQPPAAACRRRIDKNTTYASTAATTAAPTVTATATSSPAASKKWPACRPNTTNTTRRNAASLIAGRA
jgi:hypothetical protein